MISISHQHVSWKLHPQALELNEKIVSSIQQLPSLEHIHLTIMLYGGQFSYLPLPPDGGLEP
jgi:hypothetical protein